VVSGGAPEAEFQLKYFGWKGVLMPVGEPNAFQWVPRVEQLELFPDQDVALDILEKSVVVDSMVSVSASNGNGDNGEL